ncbi:hypothetical protein WJX73_004280 [Symbiochloris irregularis]|uniref:Dynein light chain n=1 Tax=Symbiochloris irregularis TaxID=706552 RepID=A0AAW1NRZ2_9CHLO
MADVAEAVPAEPTGPSKAELLQWHRCRVIDSHLSGSMEEAAVEVCLKAVHTHKENKDVAGFVKREFDKKFLDFGSEGAFHCIAGHHFASAVSHETQHFIHLLVDTLHIVLFKSHDTAEPFLD